MTIFLLTLFTGLLLSSVSAYYSIVGLTAIFAAAAMPIIIMGGSLEVCKLVAAVWLKYNWNRAPFLIKTYLTIAVIILMLITSLGCFGFLSKAHGDQTLVSGDVSAKIAMIDDQIKVEKDNLDANKQALNQLNAQVDQLLSRSTTDAGASKSAALRKAQQKERVGLLADSKAIQTRINTLTEERTPIAAQLRNVEAEVGPIKYIAAFIYGENPDANILEKAVTWVIILIVMVFDPLAIAMLLAAQMSFKWARDDKKEVTGIPHVGTLDEDTPNVVSASEAIVQEKIDIGDINYQLQEAALDREQNYESIIVVDEPVKETNTDNEPFDFSKHPYLFNTVTNAHPPGIEPVGPMVYKPEVPAVVVEEPHLDTEEVVVVDQIEEAIPVTADSTMQIVEDPEILKKKSYMIKQGLQQVVKNID